MERPPTHFRDFLLAADTQPFDDTTITVRFGITQIRQKPPPFAYQLEQPATGAFIMFMLPQMFLQLANPLTEKGNLYFWGAGITSMVSIFGNNLGLPIPC
jgi:hypothetical protein